MPRTLSAWVELHDVSAVERSSAADQGRHRVHFLASRVRLLVSWVHLVRRGGSTCGVGPYGSGGFDSRARLLKGTASWPRRFPGMARLCSGRTLARCCGGIGRPHGPRREDLEPQALGSSLG